jgi:hypothetical protein
VPEHQRFSTGETAGAEHNRKKKSNTFHGVAPASLAVKRTVKRLYRRPQTASVRPAPEFFRVNHKSPALDNHFSPISFTKRNAMPVKIS